MKGFFGIPTIQQWLVITPCFKDAGHPDGRGQSLLDLTPPLCFLAKDGILIQVVWQLLTLDPLVQPERLCVGHRTLMPLFQAQGQRFGITL